MQGSLLLALGPVLSLGFVVLVIVMVGGHLTLRIFIKVVLREVLQIVAILFALLLRSWSLLLRSFQRSESPGGPSPSRGS